VWSRRLSQSGPRGAVKQRAVNGALDWLRRELVRVKRGGSRPPSG
jgi:nicotinamide-nucleotide amidase